MATNAHVKVSTSTVANPVDFDLPKPKSSIQDWLASLPLSTLKTQFEDDGYIKIDGLLSQSEVDVFSDLYNKFLTQEIDASAHRHDLGSHEETKSSAENITQIMWPSDYVKGLAQSILHERAGAVAKVLLGDDLTFDFDMAICKVPHSDTVVPWHQDEAYWLDMPDKRAVSVWVALDNATVDNGCMWFGPGSHKLPLREHFPARPGHHVLTCNMTEEEANPTPITAGSCTMHHGRTLHYTRGNSTDSIRRAYIMNFRPQAMVDFSRNQGFDHGRAGLDEMDYSTAGEAYQKAGVETKPRKSA